MAAIIDGKAVAQQVRDEVRARVVDFESRFRLGPGLATVLVGDDPASATYVRNKGKACAKTGIASFPHELPADTPEPDLLRLVLSLNERQDVHGILVQLPLPSHIRTHAVIEALDPEKDVDGLHPYSQARLLSGREGLRPCTPLGVMRLIETTGVEMKGVRAVVIGRSQLVGKPLALLLLERHATVTLCHSRTRSLAEEVARAEILIAAIGRPCHVRGDWIRPGSVVIDVGINRTPDGKLVGDVDFAGACERAAHVTPVPGGVGPMTIAMLLSNTVTAADRQERARRAGGRP